MEKSGALPPSPRNKAFALLNPSFAQVPGAKPPENPRDKCGFEMRRW